MLVVDALQRVMATDSRIPVGGFTAALNDRMTAMWERACWPQYVERLAISATHSFSNLTITNGASQATVVDSASGGYFDALHVGKTFTIEGVSYTVSSVTDSNTLVLSGLYDFDGGGNPESGSLPRVRLNFPANFARIYRRPEPSATALRDVGDPDFGLRDPEEYRLVGPVSGVYSLECFCSLQEAYTVQYLRRPTLATGPGSTVDVSTGMERALHQGLLADLLPRVEARNEIDLAQLQARVRRAEGAYGEALQQAIRSSRGLSVREGRNRSWGFGG